MIEQLFGSKTRVKLLKLFLDNPKRSFYVREITRKIDEQINSVRRELSNLLDVGVIESDSNNNKLYYQVNTHFKHYEALKSILSGSDDDSEATQEQDSLAKRFGSLGSVSVVILTGYFANHPEISVDILIVGNVQRRRLSSLIGDLEQEEGRPLSFSILSENDFKYRLSVNDRFVSNILRHRHEVLCDTKNLLQPSHKSVDETSKVRARKRKRRDA